VWAIRERRRRAIGRRLAWLGLVVVLAGGCGGSSPTRLAAATPTPKPAIDPPLSTASPAEPTEPPESPQIERDLVDAAWARELDALVGTANVAVAVGLGDRIVYLHEGDVPRIPASNEKLLTSMAALDIWGPGHRFPTSAQATGRIRNGTLHGDLWLVGSGDPELTDERLAALASALHDAGLRRLTGSVVGDTATFDRGWWAPGWVRGLSRNYVTRTTALAIDGNHVVGLPEQLAAASLASSLARSGVQVGGTPRTGDAPDDARTIASISSAPLGEILTRQNHDSNNFDAEMVTKALGFEERGEGASTSDGADVISQWAAENGIEVRVRDGSGLSHSNQVSVAEVVTLLLLARREPWGGTLEDSLPAPGEGTLGGRLPGVPVRAKTGTLFETPASALSGYVRSAGGSRIAFSILSRGLDKTTAIRIEDGIVRLLADERTL
jgi:serine-type D-Ala-D-Ala carboxypeptidase/endopeptidase (penicillin-binding protein 4)